MSDEVSLAVGNETAKEHPEGLTGTGVGIITVVLNDMKFMSRVAQVNTATKWKKREALNSEHRVTTNIGITIIIVLCWLPSVYLKYPFLSCYIALFGEPTCHQLESIVSCLVPFLKIQRT